MRNIDDGEPPCEQLAPNAHTLTLVFHRFLDEEEWRAVVMAVRYVPFVQELAAEAVVETPEELARRRDTPERPDRVDPWRVFVEH